MCLVLSQSIKVEENDNLETRLRKAFDPLVRPEKKDVWEENWRDWFVTTKNVEDQRKPGKLKGKISSYRLYDIVHIVHIMLSGI